MQGREEGVGEVFELRRGEGGVNIEGRERKMEEEGEEEEQRVRGTTEKRRNRN